VPTAGGRSRTSIRARPTSRWTMARASRAGFEDGPNLYTLAMNGWGDPEPAWWLNLQAHPDALIELLDGPREVRARVATGDERARLWSGMEQREPNLAAYAAMRSRETRVVVVE